MYDSVVTMLNDQDTGEKLVLFIATSLDGYIATHHDSLDWLFKVEGDGDNGYSEFYGTVDSVIMGRRTYDWIMSQVDGEFPYHGKDCFVFTNSPREDTEYVRFVNTEIQPFVKKLKSEEGKNIWIVGGGELIHSFIEMDIIDEMTITIAPTILGSGIPLFKEGSYQLDLHLKRTRTFNQFVELHYVVTK